MPNGAYQSGIAGSANAPARRTRRQCAVVDGDAPVVEVGRVDASAGDRDAAEDRGLGRLVDDDFGLRRPRAGHGRRPGADHPVLARVDEPRRIGRVARPDGEALAAVEDDAGRAAVDVHGQELLAAGARIERARVARLVRRPPRAGRARSEAPRVDERPVDGSARAAVRPRRAGGRRNRRTCRGTSPRPTPRRRCRR